MADNSLSGVAREIMEHGLNPTPEALELPPQFAPLAEVIYDVPERPDDFDPEIEIIDKPADVGLLVSGGLDSTVAYLMAREDYDFENIYPFYCDMGQSYSEKEQQALRDMGIPYELIEVPPIEGANDESWKHIQPGRNFLYLSLVAERLPRGGEVWLGAVDGEIPKTGGDKSEEFMNRLSQILSRLLPRPVYLQAPIMNLTKGDLVKWAKKNGHLDTVGKTVSCFSAETDGRCGGCQSCLRTFFAFSTADEEVEFDQHPMEGASQYVEKYKRVFAEAKRTGDYSHYSPRRVQEDSAAITLWEREHA